MTNRPHTATGARIVIMVMRVVLLLVTAVGFMASDLSAQAARNRLDHRGTEFRIAFLHTNGYDDRPQFSLIIGNERPTRGTITYLWDNKVVDVVLGQANGVTRIDLDTNSLLLPPPREAPISRRTILARFDDEVSIYGVNTQRWSSDIFLGLPVDATGFEHVVLAYPNTLSPDPAVALVGGSDFPSQFAVVATADNTILDVIPSVQFTSRVDASPFQVRLDAGEIYFAQALGGIGRDLSGTRVKGDKPIVVFGSHQRANIPYDQAVGRDHLIEQLPALVNWGTRYFVTPHFQLPKTLADANVMRLIAIADSTVIKIDSAVATTLRARQVVELPLNRAMELTGNKPFLVAQYQHSTADERNIRQENDSIGDPFMMLSVPPALYDSIYWFQSLLNREMRVHYVNVVIPTERIGSLRLDGNPITAGFNRIANTSYSYAQIPVRAGDHVIRGDVPFGLFVYGYGPYNSYGYPGGMVFDTLYKDQKPPDFRWYDTCGGIVGQLIDGDPRDFGVDAVRLTDGSQNVTLFTDPFRRGDDTLPFHVRLIDPYEDGVAVLLGVDTAGLDRHYRVPVKGFTVAISRGQSGPSQLDTLSSLNGREFCTEFTLRNYGRYPQVIASLVLSDSVDGLRIDTPFPLTLQPGATQTISVCYVHVGDTSFVLDISIDNGCIERPVARVPVISGNDTIVPIQIGDFDPCQGDRTILFKELGALNSGVQSVVVNQQLNAEVTVSPELPAREVLVRISRIDPYKDMIYSLTVTDRVGNTTTVTDTVGGFTLAVRDASSSHVGLRVDRPVDYGNVILTQERCDTIYLENYGIRPLELRRPRVVGNLQYSIPPAQLPIVLRPGERRPLLVCLHPTFVGVQYDTLVIDFECGNPQEKVALVSMVDPLQGVSSDLCGNGLTFQIGEFVKKNFLQTPFPNPSHGSTTTLTLGLSHPANVTLTLHNDLGIEVARLFDRAPMPGGVVRFDARLGDLPSGSYFLIMTTSDGTLSPQRLVITR